MRWYGRRRERHDAADDRFSLMTGSPVAGPWRFRGVPFTAQPNCGCEGLQPDGLWSATPEAAVRRELETGELAQLHREEGVRYAWGGLEEPAPAL